MKESLVALVFFVLATGTPVKAQLPPADASASHDFLAVGEDPRLVERRPACSEPQPLCVVKSKSTIAGVRTMRRVDGRAFPRDRRADLDLSLAFNKNPAFVVSFAILESVRSGTKKIAFSLSESSQGAAYTPPTGGDRTQWVLNSSFGWKSLVVGVTDSAWGTARNSPREWHGTWEGFGKRFGTRQAGVSISNTVEGALGAVWGEDPRYLRSGRKGFWPRTGYALKMAILAQYRSGATKPAYARFIGTVGNNFATNAWRPPSESDWEHALIRSGWGITARMMGNLVIEFWR